MKGTLLEVYSRSNPDHLPNTSLLLPISVLKKFLELEV